MSPRVGNSAKRQGTPSAGASPRSTPHTKSRRVSVSGRFEDFRQNVPPPRPTLPSLSPASNDGVQDFLQASPGRLLNETSAQVSVPIIPDQQATVTEGAAHSPQQPISCHPGTPIVFHTRDKQMGARPGLVNQHLPIDRLTALSQALPLARQETVLGSQDQQSSAQAEYVMISEVLGNKLQTPTRVRMNETCNSSLEGQTRYPLRLSSAEIQHHVSIASGIPRVNNQSLHTQFEHSPTRVQSAQILHDVSTTARQERSLDRDQRVTTDNATHPIAGLGLPYQPPFNHGVQSGIWNNPFQSNTQLSQTQVSQFPSFNAIGKSVRPHVTHSVLHGNVAEARDQSRHEVQPPTSRHLTRGTNTQSVPHSQRPVAQNSLGTRRLSGSRVRFPVYSTTVPGSSSRSRLPDQRALPVSNDFRSRSYYRRGSPITRYNIHLRKPALDAAHEAHKRLMAQKHGYEMIDGRMREVTYVEDDVDD